MFYFAFESEDMKKEYKKKAWSKPAVYTLSIKKDTFSGTVYGAEPGNSKAGNIPKK